MHLVKKGRILDPSLGSRFSESGEVPRTSSETTCLYVSCERFQGPPFEGQHLGMWLHSLKIWPHLGPWDQGCFQAIVLDRISDGYGSDLYSPIWHNMCSCLNDVANSFPVIFLSTVELPTSALIPRQLRFLSSKPKLPLIGNGKILPALSHASFWSWSLLSTCCLSRGSPSVSAVFCLTDWRFSAQNFSHETLPFENNLR